MATPPPTTPRLPRIGPPGALGVWTGGAAFVAGALSLLNDRELRGLAILPVLLSLALYAAVFGVATAFGPGFFEAIWPRPEGWLVWLWTFALILVGLGLLVGLFFLFATVVEIVGGPFFEKMAHAVLRRSGVTPQDAGFWSGTVLDLVRVALIALPAGVLFVLGFVPGIGGPALTAAVVVSWFGLASGALSPSLTATGHGLQGRLFLPVGWLGTTLGLGAATGLTLLVPVLGLFAVPASVVGGALLVAARERARPPRAATAS